MSDQVFKRFSINLNTPHLTYDQIMKYGPDKWRHREGDLLFIQFLYGHKGVYRVEGPEDNMTPTAVVDVSSLDVSQIPVHKVTGLLFTDPAF